MRCAHCGREFSPRRRWLRSKAWCSAACRRRMTAEARDVMLWVARWGPAVHRPATVARYDDLLQRFVTASLRPPVTERPLSAPPPDQPDADRRPPRISFPYVDLDELPLDEPPRRAVPTRRRLWLRRRGGRSLR